MAMASTLKPRPSLHRHSTLISVSSCPIILSFPHCKTTSGRFRACTLRTGSDGGRVGNPESYGSDLLRKPSILPEKDLDAISEEDEDMEEKEKFVTEVKEWIDWEDQILADTVPLVGFVRMILHSDKYKSGERLSPEHERTIVERLLPHHPECEKKIGCGIDYITVGYHPDFVGSRCLFIVRKDGELVDFSYWKCIKGLIRKNYPLYADSFILRHFRRRRRNG